MDGNGRWAGLRGLPRVAGHREGVRAARQAVRTAGRLGIEYLTLYAFSSENWTRPAAEVSFLMRLLESSVDEELPEPDREQRPAPGARRDRQPGRGRAAERRARRRGHPAEHGPHAPDRAQLRRPAGAGPGGAKPGGQRVARGELAPEAIDEAGIAAALDTAGVPDPDLLIRTSGEYRLSNFLLWQVAYTELLVLPTLWPDFSPQDLYGAVAEYQRRSRRFGGL